MNRTILNAYEEILCRKPDESGSANYKNKLQTNKNFNLRQRMILSDEYTNRVKYKNILIYLRFKRFSGDGICIAAERLITVLRKFYTVSSIEYDSNDSADSIIDRIREVGYNNRGNKTLLVHISYSKWLKELLEWWNVQPADFNKNVTGYLYCGFSKLESYKIPVYRLFKKIIVPSQIYKTIFEKELSNSIYVLPYLINRTLVTPPKRCAPEKEIVLYTIDNGQNITNLLTLSLWTITFISINPTINLKMIIKTKTKAVENKLIEFINELNLASKITVITDLIPYNQLEEIHNKGNIFLTLNNLNSSLVLSEAILHGNIVICPKSGGCINYLPPDYPYFIRVIKDYIGTYISICRDKSIKDNEYLIHVPESNYLYEMLYVAINDFQSSSHVDAIQTAQQFLINASAPENIKNFFEAYLLDGNT